MWTTTKKWSRILFAALALSAFVALFVVGLINFGDGATAISNQSLPVIRTSSSA